MDTSTRVKVDLISTPSVLNAVAMPKLIQPQRATFVHYDIFLIDEYSLVLTEHSWSFQLMSSSAKVNKKLLILFIILK